VRRKVSLQSRSAGLTPSGPTPKRFLPRSMVLQRSSESPLRTGYHHSVRSPRYLGPVSRNYPVTHFARMYGRLSESTSLRRQAHRLHTILRLLCLSKDQFFHTKGRDIERELSMGRDLELCGFRHTTFHLHLLPVLTRRGTAWKKLGHPLRSSAIHHQPFLSFHPESVLGGSCDPL